MVNSVVCRVSLHARHLRGTWRLTCRSRRLQALTSCSTSTCSIIRRPSSAWPLMLQTGSSQPTRVLHSVRTLRRATTRPGIGILRMRWRPRGGRLWILTTAAVARSKASLPRWHGERELLLRCQWTHRWLRARTWTVVLVAATGPTQGQELLCRERSRYYCARGWRWILSSRVCLR